MNVLAAFVELIRSLPAIVGFLVELMKLWNEYLDASKRRETMVKLQGAIKDARTAQDTTSLTALVNSIVTSKPGSS